MPTYEVDVGGKTYEVDAPNPDTAWQWANYTHSQSAAQPSTERTWGEAAQDVGAGLVSGLGNVVQLPGQLYGLATGDFRDTGLLGAGKDIQEYGESLKSEGLKAREAARAAKVQEAEKEGQFSSFLTSLGETVKDPALLTSFLAEQAPQLIPMILTGAGAGVIASKGVMSAAAARGAAEEAAKRLASRKAIQAGTETALQTGAVMQGADVGASTYDDAYKAMLERGATPEQAGAEVINLARAAGVSGYLLSLLGNKYMPGGKALEEILAGKATGAGMIRGAIGTGLKEIPGENIEEVGGQVTRNLAMREINPEQSLTEGLGQTAAMATLGAAGMGGAAGIVGGRGAPRVVPEVTSTEQEQAPEAPITAEEEETSQVQGTFAERQAAREKAAEEAKAAAEAKAAEDLKAKYDAAIAREQELANKTRSIQEEQELKNLRVEMRTMKQQLDETTETPTPGAKDVAGLDTGAGGAGATVSAPATDTLSSTEGTVTPEPSGVVSAGQDVSQPSAGAVTQPPALTQTTGETLGTQAPQTKQAETQRQEPVAKRATYNPEGVDSALKFNNGETRYSLEFAGDKPQLVVRDPKAGNLVFYPEGKKFDSRSNVHAISELSGMFGVPAELVSAINDWATSIGDTRAAAGQRVADTVSKLAEGKEAPAAAPVTSTTRKTKLDSDESFLDSMFGDDGLPSRGSAALTPEQAKQEAKVESMAADYGLARMADESIAALAKRLKKVMTERRNAEQEFVRRTTMGGEPVAAIEDQLLAQQSLMGRKPISIPAEQQEMYQEMREAYNQNIEDETEALPEFSKLTPDEKVKYFQEHVSRNSWDEHERAAKALSGYLESKRTAAEEVTREGTKTGAPVQETIGKSKEARDRVRARDSYQRERSSFSRKSGIAYELPAWGDLSEESQRLYASINRTDTVLEQDMAFRAVKKQVQKEQQEERSKMGAEAAEQRATQEMEAAAERARQSQPAGKGEVLPLSAIKMLARGDISGVLSYLNEKGSGLKPKTARMLGMGKVKVRDSVAQKIFRALAGALSNVEGLKVNVVFDKNMVHDQIARYDANTNTLYVGPNGLDEATILHELVHAATVKIIHQYFTDKTKLDARQIAAVEQIQKIAGYAKRALGTRYPNAFENLYEFVAYAMTDMQFQNELAQIQVPGLAKATAKTAEETKQLEEAGAEGETERGLGRVTTPTLMFESLWDAFTGTLAWMYKLFRPEQQRTKILTPTEKTRQVGRKGAAEKQVAPREFKEKQELTAEEREALAPETLFDNPEVEANEATIPAEPGEMVTERGVTNLQRAILREPGYKGNLLLEAAAAIQDIMAAPEGGIEALAGKETVSSELYVKKPAGQQQRKKAPAQDNSVEGMRSRNKLPEMSTMSSVRKQWTGRKAYNTLKTKFQNSRDAIKRIEDAAAKAGKVIYDGLKTNAVYTQIVLASGRAKDLFLTMVEPHAAKLREAIGDYAKAAGMNVEEAARDLHIIGMAMHEGERRDVKYMLNVPLSTDKKTITLSDGSTISMAPSQFRIEVMQEIFSGKLTKQQIKDLRTDLNNVVKQYADANGFSGIDAATPGGYKSVDRNATEYNVVGGYSSADMQNALDKLYTNQPAKVKSAVDTAMKAMRGLHDTTKKLDKESNYWSAPVQSVVDFYGWENYVPLKGKQHFVGKNDDLLSFDGPRLGTELQEKQYSFEGRETESDNALLQSMVDATRAAMRAGRKDVTLAIKNAVKDKLVYGELVKEKVPFAERDGLYQEFSGPNYVYHYNKDGSVDVIKLTDKGQREAIKRTYQESQPLVDMLNTVTSTIGMLHTRYNVAFAPMNFVRDALTNAFMLGADMGPARAAQYIGSIAAKVVNGGLYKAWQVSRLYEGGNFAEIERMAKKDPYVASMYAYIQKGGKVSYLQGITSKSQQAQLQRDLSSGNLKKAKAAVDKVMDVWVDMFELASRSTAYDISKSQFRAEGLSEKEAEIKATAYAKNLANFEQVGEWGRAAGAMFMFFRPAATGAVRAIEALEPAFRSLDSAKADLPQAVLNDKAAMAKFEAEYKKRAAAARVMSLGLLGMGAMIYMMAYAMADDDDYGRNRVGTDDAARWSRYARFFIPGMENPVQIPWGFGLGAFAAAGAQFASVGFGKTSVSDAVMNTALIGMDSFLPLPVSRINPMEQPAAWLIDSALPSTMRPLVEWTMNMDGLGREIYNNRQSRFGDAYTGGDNIPEMYKAASRMLYDATNGSVDWSPNTLYFFANNYLDGVTRLGGGVANIGMVMAGQKEFSPKTDTILFDSFFGAPSNVDAREFSNAEKKILDIKKRLVTLENNNPAGYAKYVEDNPMHPYIVETYDKQVNQELRKLRQEANVYRRMQGLSPKDRNTMVKNLVSMQNFVKRDILNMMDAYGLNY